MNRAPSFKSRSVWLFVTASLVLLMFVAVLRYERVSAVLGLVKMEPHFSDWLAILAAGDARQAGADVYAIPNRFDPFGRPHVYGPWWLVLGDLGFTIADLWWMGGLLALSFIIVATLLLAPRTGLQAALAAGVLSAPPIMLGLERANNDLVIFLLLVFAAWLVARLNRAGPWSAVTIVAVAAALKMYPVAGFAALPATRCARRVKLTAVSAVFVLLVFVVWVYSADYLQVLKSVPREVSVFAFGFSIFLKLAENILSSVPQWPIIFGILTALSLAGTWIAPRVSEVWHQVPLQGGTAFAFVAGAACWIFCYIGNTNFSYRAVLLLLPARLWLCDWYHVRQGLAARRCFLLVLLFMWAGCGTACLHAWSEQNLERLPLFWIMASFEQTLALLLTVTLMLSIGGWIARHAGLRVNRGALGP